MCTHSNGWYVAAVIKKIVLKKFFLFIFFFYYFFKDFTVNRHYKFQYTSIACRRWVLIKFKTKSFFTCSCTDRTFVPKNTVCILMECKHVFLSLIHQCENTMTVKQMNEIANDYLLNESNSIVEK